MKTPNKIRSILFPNSSIIFMVLMWIAFSQPNSIGESLDVPELILVMSVFFVLFILPYDLIRWLLWGRNKYYRKCTQYEDANRRIASEQRKACQKANQLIEQAKKYSDILNNTTNLNVFELYFEKLKSTLEELVLFEQYDIFPDVTPTEDLEELLLRESDLRETFEERTKNKYTFTTNTAPHVSHKFSYGMSDEELRRFALICNHELEKEDEKNHM